MSLLETDDVYLSITNRGTITASRSQSAEPYVQLEPLPADVDIGEDLDINAAKTIVAAARGRQLAIYNTELVPVHTVAVNAFSVRFYMDTTILLVGTESGELWKYDASEQTQMATLAVHPNRINEICVNSTGDLICCAGYDHTVGLVDFHSFTVIRKYSGHTDWVRSVIFLPISNFIVSGADDGHIHVWDVSSSASVHSNHEHTSLVLALDAHSSLPQYASGSSDRRIIVWCAQTYSQLFVVTAASEVASVCFSYEENVVFGGVHGHGLTSFDYRSGNALITYYTHIAGIPSVRRAKRNGTSHGLADVLFVVLICLLGAAQTMATDKIESECAGESTIPALPHIPSNGAGQPDLATRLREFYAVYAPQQYRMAEEMASTYFGLEDELNSILKDSYGADLNTGNWQVEVGGDGVRMEHMGPIVIQPDGSLRRITNWYAMTPAERSTTVRRVLKRNKERLDLLKAKDKQL